MSLPVSDMICFSLYSATHAMQAAYKPLLDEIGLTYPQYLVLTALWQTDGQSVGQIGQTLQLESNTLTPLLKRMEGQGLVTRSRSREDERQVRVSLTEAGHALQTRAAHIPACILEKSGMTLQALTALRDQINALRGHLRAS
jgi:MarR family transcriptional regulator, organic hydroperoxide resistance regulator